MHKLLSVFALGAIGLAARPALACGSDAPAAEEPQPSEAPAAPVSSLPWAVAAPCSYPEAPEVSDRPQVRQPFSWCVGGGVCLPLELEVDLEQSRLSVSNAELSGSANDPNPQAARFRATAGDLGFDHPMAIGANLRFSVGARHSYWGMALGVAGAEADGPGTPADNKLRQGSALVRVTMGVLGGALIDLPVVRLRADVTAGMHALVVSLPGLGNTCDSSKCTASVASSVLPWVAPRVAAELRAGAVSLGVYASTDLLPRFGDDLSVGSYLAFHSTQFGF